MNFNNFHRLLLLGLSQLSLLSVCITQISAQGTITLNPSTITSSNPSSYIVGIQRNHIFAQVKDPLDLSNTAYSNWFSDMLNRYKQIQPGFGNGKKLYRLGGNQIDGMISTLQENEFQNPTRQNFVDVVNACKNQISAKSSATDVFGNGQIYRVYNNLSDAAGPNDKFIYFEDGDYKGYHWANYTGKISNKTGGSALYGQYDDIKYYITEAKTMDADLTVTVNFSSGTPNEAIGLINEIKNQYNGSLARLQFIELGNEVSEPYIKGNRNYFGVDEFGNCVEYFSKSKNRKEYASYALEFAYKLRQWLDSNGGNHVKIGAVGTTNSYWAWNDPNPISANQNLSDILTGTNSAYPGKRLLDYIDFVIYHSYPSYPIIHPGGEYGTRLKNPNTGLPYSDSDMAKLYLAQTPWNNEKRFQDQIDIINSLTTKDIKLANSEYYSHLNQKTRPNLTHSISEGIYTADNMISALKFDMEMAVNFAFYHFQSSQVEISDNLLFDVNAAGQVVGEKTVYAVQKLIAEELGTQVIEASDNFANNTSYDIDISSLAFWDTPESNFKYKPLGYVATKKANGDNVLLIVNRSDQAVPLTINNTGMSNPSGQINSIKGNAYTDQSRLTPTGFSQLTTLNNFNIPKLSVNILKISNGAQNNIVTLIDMDGDGFAGINDCNDTDPNIPATPGTACNDGNSSTTNDIIQSDGCTCSGTPANTACVIGFNSLKVVDVGANCKEYQLTIQPLQTIINSSIQITGLPAGGFSGSSVTPTTGGSLNWGAQTSYNWTASVLNAGETYIAKLKYCWQPNYPNATATSLGCSPYSGGCNIDSDNDGICASQDCNDNDPNYPKTPGTACNDNNNSTTNDVIQSDGCSCMGTTTIIQPPTSTCDVGFSRLEVVNSSSNCRDYELDVNPTQTISNARILISNLPAGGFAGSTVSPGGTGALNWASQTSYNWDIPLLNAGQPYTAKIKYCWQPNYPAPTANYASCPSYNGGPTTTASSCAIGFSSFNVGTDVTDPNCKMYVLEIQPQQSQSNVKINLGGFPTNGSAGYTTSPNNSSTLNWASQNSYEWVLPNVSVGQTYQVTIKYCWMNSVTYPSADYDGCQPFVCQ